MSDSLAAALIKELVLVVRVCMKEKRVKLKTRRDTSVAEKLSTREDASH